MVKLYFAHPISTYGTDRERMVLEALWEVCQDMEIDEIVNPATMVKPELFDTWDGSERMEWFKEKVRECYYFAFIPFEDGKIGAGVMAEIAEFLAFTGRAVVEMLDDGNCAVWGWDQLILLTARALSITETRERIAQGIV